MKYLIALKIAWVILFGTSVNAADTDDKQSKSFWPGTNGAVKEIEELSEEEKANLEWFAKYIPNILLMAHLDNISLPKAFDDFRWSDIAPFSGHAYCDNTYLFALMFYLETEGAVPVEIKSSYAKDFSDLTFTFEPCVDGEDVLGKRVEGFGFKDMTTESERRSTFRDQSLENLIHTSFRRNFTEERLRDRASGSSSSSFALPALPSLVSHFFCSAEYEFTIFKLEKDTFRVNIILRSKDDRDSDMKVQKVANFKVVIKSADPETVDGFLKCAVL